MANFNKVLLIGNLTRDPEVRTTPSGTKIAKFGLAVNRRFRTRDEETREETTFVDIDAFGPQAEIIERYCQKGSPLFVEGRLRLDQWETGSGDKRSKLTVVLENFQFLGGGSGQGQAGESAGASGRSGDGDSNGTGTTGKGPDTIEDDNIPF
ncbi:MAG: single-stranded DNA-binding protein [Oceanipulchritudo sp.]